VWFTPRAGSTPATGNYKETSPNMDLFLYVPTARILTEFLK